MPRVDQASKRAASKRRSALADALKLSGEQQERALRKLHHELSALLAKATATRGGEASAAAAAAARAEGAEAEARKERATDERLRTLLAQLQQRQQVVISQREALLHAEERERHELSEYFKQRIEEVNEGLNAQGSERVENLGENERLHAALVSLANDYERREKAHAAHLVEAAAVHAALEAEMEKVRASLDALEEERAALLEREAGYFASDQQMKEVLEGYAQEFEKVQVELKETNKRYSEHSAELTQSSARLREGERTHQTLKTLKAGQSKVIKPLRALIKERETELARVSAQCDKLSVVRDQLRSELGLEPDGCCSTANASEGGETSTLMQGQSSSGNEGTAAG
ncbi:hypothetical protein AB1Y20_002456 [Prymnesium parvum]|uniref:Uncharacterized protein n=1 Tax=Prymnesium parvum TaxID=97485 RepID=A0AB34JAY0_PRYPA